MTFDAQMLPRILRDVTDGVILLDLHGTVMYVNPSGMQILALDDRVIGQKYAPTMFGNGIANDSFHQFLLDAVYDKVCTHHGSCDYILPDGKTLKLGMVSSFLKNEDGTESEGVVIQFSDVTELADMRRREHDATMVFVSSLGFLCFWTIITALWETLGRPLPTGTMTLIVTLLGFIVMAVLVSKTSITWKDVGLKPHNLKRVLITDGIIAAAALLLLCVIKLFVMRLSPGFFDTSKPFFNWGALTLSRLSYPFVVFLQELVSRGFVHESMRRVISGKHRETAAIIVSSLMFGALHYFLGLTYMVGAMLLLGILGAIYRKQNTIWGLCIPHLVLGLAVVVLGFV